MRRKEKGPLGWHLRGLQFRKSVSIDGETLPVLAFPRNVFAGAIMTDNQVWHGATNFLSA